MAWWALLLDVFGVVTALLAAWLWYAAGRRRLRRISRFETLDAADINRIVTTINRTSLLNSRAALAAAASAASLSVRFAADLLALLTDHLSRWRRWFPSSELALTARGQRYCL